MPLLSLQELIKTQLHVFNGHHTGIKVWKGKEAPSWTFLAPCAVVTQGWWIRLRGVRWGSFQSTCFRSHPLQWLWGWVPLGRDGVLTPGLIIMVAQIRFSAFSCFLPMMVVIGGGWAVILGHFQDDALIFLFRSRWSFISLHSGVEPGAAELAMAWQVK